MKRWIRVLIAIAMLAFLFVWAGSESLLQTLARFQPRYLVPLLIVSALMIWVSCVKWRIFLGAQGKQVSMLYLVQLYTIGYFFNLFTPSFIGGDVARSYKLGKRLGTQQLGTQADAFVATFLERFTGLLAMVLLAFGSVVLGATITHGMELSVFVVTFGAIMLTVICFSERAAALALRMAEWCMKFFAAKYRTQIVKLLKKLHAAFAESRQQKRLIIPALAWSFVFHVVAVCNTYIAALAIGWENPSFSGMFVATPLALLVGMVPLTPSGLGIQEGAFVFFLERIGADPGEGLLVALILRAKAVLLGLLGGALLWWDSGRVTDFPAVNGNSDV